MAYARTPTERQWQIAAAWLALGHVADERRRWIEALKTAGVPRPSMSWTHYRDALGVQVAVAALVERERAIAQDREIKTDLLIPDYVGGMPARRPAAVEVEVVDETATPAAAAPAVVDHAPNSILARISETRRAAFAGGQYQAALQADLSIVTLLGMIPEDFRAATSGQLEARKAIAELTPEEIQSRLKGLLG